MKRQSMKQKEAAQKAALYRRLCDIMSMCESGEDPASDGFCVFLSDVPALIKAIELRLLPKDYKEKKAFLTSVHNIDEYGTAKNLTDFLFRNGIRA